MKKSESITVKGLSIGILKNQEEEYISLSGIARFRDPERSDYILQNWMRNRSTIEFIGLWEQLNNPDFNSIEFEGFKYQAGSNSFSLTPKRWIESTCAIGIISKAGKYGGTYAHKDIAFEFASWVSPEFKLYLIKEFQRLKEQGSTKKNLEWNFHRTLAKINYHIHTEAIKEHLIPKQLSRTQLNLVYASEADLLNVALFGLTAKEWRKANKKAEGNIRDNASIEQLVVLSNLESLNAVLINQKLSQPERLKQLNGTAISQMKSLINNRQLKELNNP